jgi:hypothetical protein
MTVQFSAERQDAQWRDEFPLGTTFVGRHAAGNVRFLKN